VRNDADSGVGGNAWAFDNFVRQIVVVKTGDRTYCAITRYGGVFTTIDGTSPGGAGHVSAGIVGAFGGGYRSTAFTADFAPTKPTSGSIGTVNYGCDASFNCPGRFDWTTLYFTNVAGFDLAWWGWLYKTQAHGTWLNAITGNVGDIAG
jgi:hypothetical protein